jgi:tripartite-type tricarboxylate transporter receptor subunit TctC
MKFTRRSILAGAASVGATTLFTPAHAQSTLPPLRVIMPFGAGSGVDTLVRAAQNALSKAMGGRAVVIENLPGAGGITGTQQLVRSAPDGNTISFVSPNHAVNPAVYKKLPYDSLGDITPISYVGDAHFVMVVNPKRLPVGNATELAAALKARPDQYNFASSGNGTITHLAVEMFLDAADVKAKHIPYKGVGPMTTDLMAGTVDFGVFGIPAIQGQLKSGALTAVGTMGNVRAPSMPNVPTFKEQGFRGVEVTGWFVAIGPKNLPAAQVKYLHDAISTAFTTPELVAAWSQQDTTMRPTSPEVAAAFLRSEQARYGDIAKKANVSLD